MSIFKGYEEMTPDQQVAWKLGRAAGLEEAEIKRLRAALTHEQMLHRNDDGDICSGFPIVGHCVICEQILPAVGIPQRADGDGDLVESERGRRLL